MITIHCDKHDNDLKFELDCPLCKLENRIKQWRRVNRLICGLKPNSTEGTMILNAVKSIIKQVVGV